MKWSSTEKISRASARRPWVVVGIWVALLVGAGFLTTGIGEVLTTEFKYTTKPDSVKADELLEERLRGPQQDQEVIILRSEDMTVDDPAFRAAAERIVTELRAETDTVESALSFYETQAPGLVSESRRIMIVPVTVIGDVGEGADNVGPIVDIVEEANGRDGVEVMTAGRGSIARTFNELSQEDAETGERIGVPVALLILLLVFGAAVAAGVPIVMAIVAIVVAFGSLTLLGRAYELSFLVTSIVPMIGLAVGIDYTLLIVQRFREERAHGLKKMDAIGMAGATASRTVLFSGGTVIVGLLGMMVVPSTVYRSIALATSVVTLVAVVAALTLLPAVLSLLGDKVNALRVPFLGGGAQSADDANGGFWGRVAATVMAHPWVSVGASVAVLVALAVPALGINLGLAGVSTLPEGNERREAFEILDQEFSAGRISPVEVVVAADDVASEDIERGIERLEAAIATDGMFGEPQFETNSARDLLLVSFPIHGDPTADAAHDAIKRLRGDIIPAAFQGIDAEVLVTGETAGNEDFYDVIRTYAPYVFAFVLGLSFLLLMVVFRSVVVPVKALIMNLLSVGAAYGLLVLVFQEGVGSDLLGFQQTETIEAWLPLFLFSVLFGLSMDYHVFLLSRIRERFDETHDNAGSVAYGLRSTAAMITGAALIMVAVFGGFALGETVSLQQVGFGLAVAVILDATIIRSVLVPASMQLLGDWNWYLPSWLQWLPRLHVEGPNRGPQAPAPEGAFAAGS